MHVTDMTKNSEVRWQRNKGKVARDDCWPGDLAGGQKLVRNRNTNSQRLSCIVRNFAGTRTATLKPDTRGQLIGQVIVRISRRGFRAITLKILMAIVKDKRRVSTGLFYFRSSCDTQSCQRLGYDYRHQGQVGGTLRIRRSWCPDSESRSMRCMTFSQVLGSQFV